MSVLLVFDTTARVCGLLAPDVSITSQPAHWLVVQGVPVTVIVVSEPPEAVPLCAPVSVQVVTWTGTLKM